MRLVLARPALSTWTFVEVDEMDTGTTAVVGRKGPGAYRDLPSGAARDTTNDAGHPHRLRVRQRAYIWNRPDLRPPSGRPVEQARPSGDI